MKHRTLEPETIQRWSFRNILVMICASVAFYFVFSSAFSRLVIPDDVPTEIYFYDADANPVPLLDYLGTPFSLHIQPLSHADIERCLKQDHDPTTILVPNNLPELPRIRQQLAEAKESSNYCRVLFATGAMLERYAKMLGVQDFPVRIVVAQDFSVLRVEKP
ncbi:hypothetical protein [Desulfurispira natronophila]|uniref:Uncharacterized protein n=1 Tax=Desulfurispira natronophila TaxID=682562 RepID=A0A7W7Y668_9BACT|nr:hypothetical protein [Desulfurispira natronophila]MBB5022467.1 hypothetical protein [Desulfurispira natronophila]